MKPMTKLYSVKDWGRIYENAGSRKIAGRLDWVPIPTRHDGLSYKRLMRRNDGLELYACWILIVAVAAKCPTRGVLADDDGPLSAEDVALKAGVSSDAMIRAFEVFASKEIGWLIGRQVVDQREQLLLQDRTGQDLTGPEPASAGFAETPKASSTKPADDSPVFLVFECVGRPSEFELRESLVSELQGLFPSVDLRGECRKALAWLRANPGRRKSHRGMRRFLTGWITRANDGRRGGSGSDVGGPGGIRPRPSIDPSAFGDDDPFGGGN